MFSKLKIVEFYYTTEEEMNDKINDELTEFSKDNNDIPSKVKQVLEQRVKSSESLGDKNYIKLVLEIK